MGPFFFLFDASFCFGCLLLVLPCPRSKNEGTHMFLLFEIRVSWLWFGFRGHQLSTLGWGSGGTLTLGSGDQVRVRAYSKLCEDLRHNVVFTCGNDSICSTVVPSNWRDRSKQELVVLSCLVLSCLVLSCLVLSCLVLSCLVLSCLVLSLLVLSCLVLSR